MTAAGPLARVENGMEDGRWIWRFERGLGDSIRYLIELALSELLSFPVRLLWKLLMKVIVVITFLTFTIIPSVHNYSLDSQLDSMLFSFTIA